MNILAISDLYVPSGVMADALAALNPTRLTVIDWPNDSTTQLHHRIRQIERFGPDAELPPENLWDQLPEADLIVTHMCPLNSEVIRRAPRLRLIGVCRSACENVDVKSAAERNIPIVSTPARNAVAVAEFTVALMIAERRNIARAHLSLATAGWRKTYLNDSQPSELSGKTVGLAGFGAVGQMVAERLKGFGVRLLVYDPMQPEELVKRSNGRAVDFEELLRESDVLSLHARRGPLDPYLIGVRELACMKPTAYLINTARGSIVDPDALAKALREKRIAGAALDVFEQEPLAADSPLRTLDNITLTPHLAGSTVEAFHNAPRLLVDRIRIEL